MATQPEAKTDVEAEKAYAAASAKETVKNTAAKKEAAPRRKPAAPSKSISKEPAMTEPHTPDYTAQMTEGLADLQARAKSAYEQGTEYAAEMRELGKGNLDAFVESGRIFAAAMQDMARVAADEGKTAVETATADAREFAAVKSPTDFVQLQGTIASRNFDIAVAQLSKATEAWVKLANDVAAPLSSRVSLAMEKARKAA